jgi:adenine-specific DNA-methyltransferase
VKSFSKTGVFPITNPNTNVEYLPPRGRCWRFNIQTYARLKIENGIYFGKNGDGAPSNEGDIVLDCFSGSGTTLSVAHKMKRKWLGNEIGDHADTHIITRLKGVIGGNDNIGISHSVNWQGGGSFKYYHLGESIIKIDKETGKGEFNWSLGKQFIQESLSVSYDFVVQKDIDVFPAQIFKDNNTTVGKLIGKIIIIYSLSFPFRRKRATISNERIKSIYNNCKQDFNSLVI